MTREEARTILATWLGSAKGTKEQRGYIEGWFDKSDEEAFEKAIEALQTETKHGKWIYDGKKIKGGIEWVHCSNCGQKGDAKSILMKHGNYCPNCGAKMDKEREYAERGGECMPLYYFARADQMTDHNFTDDVAITYAQDKAEAIKKFSKLYDDIKDDEVNAVSWGHNNGVAILTDY